MKIETEKLKALLSRAAKGAGCNAFMPITNFCHFDEGRNKLSITTTDGFSTLVVSCEAEDRDKHVRLDFVGDFSSIYKLVSKFTCKDTKIYVADTTLFIEGNGKYKMPLPLDECDRPVIFPSVDVVSANPETIYADNIRDIIKTNKSSLPKTSECPELIGYMFDDGVYTTNSLVLCKNLCRTFKNTVMFRPSDVEVLSMFEDCINVTHENDKYMFADDETLYVTYASCEQDEFPLDAVKNLIDTGFEYGFMIKKKDFLAALDRVYLFVTQYDYNACHLIITNNTLYIRNKDMTGIESIDIVGCSVPNDVHMVINIDFLMSVLKTMQDDVTFTFGNDRCIGLSDELTKRIIAIKEIVNDV